MKIVFNFQKTITEIITKIQSSKHRGEFIECLMKFAHGNEVFQKFVKLIEDVVNIKPLSIDWNNKVIELELPDEHSQYKTDVFDSLTFISVFLVEALSIFKCSDDKTSEELKINGVLMSLFEVYTGLKVLKSIYEGKVKEIEDEIIEKFRRVIPPDKIPSIEFLKEEAKKGGIEPSLVKLLNAVYKELSTPEEQTKIIEEIASNDKLLQIFELDREKVMEIINKTKENLYKI